MIPTTFNKDEFRAWYPALDDAIRESFDRNGLDTPINRSFWIQYCSEYVHPNGRPRRFGIQGVISFLRDNGYTIEIVAYLNPKK